jgi:hypothetical protein
VAEFPDRERLRPTVEGRIRLLAAIEAAGQLHVVDAGTLGEYADLVVTHGQIHADTSFPEVAAHLASGCPNCTDDLGALVEELAVVPSPLPSPPHAGEGGQPDGLASIQLGVGGQGDGFSADRRGAEGQPPVNGGAERGARGTTRDESGIHAADLPDPRAAEHAEAARRARLRRVRDWLLIGAAVAILLMGLSLVGLAYLASNRPEPRMGLTPLPVTVPATTPGASRAAPSDMACPGSHPVKGNRASMLYHQPGGAFYEQTRPEDCFGSPADAEAAGYRRSQR